MKNNQDCQLVFDCHFFKHWNLINDRSKSNEYRTQIAENFKQLCENGCEKNLNKTREKKRKRRIVHNLHSKPYEIRWAIHLQTGLCFWNFPRKKRTNSKHSHIFGAEIPMQLFWKPLWKWLNPMNKKYKKNTHTQSYRETKRLFQNTMNIWVSML